MYYAHPGADQAPRGQQRVANSYYPQAPRYQFVQPIQAYGYQPLQMLQGGTHQGNSPAPGAQLDNPPQGEVEEGRCKSCLGSLGTCLTTVLGSIKQAMCCLALCQFPKTYESGESCGCYIQAFDQKALEAFEGVMQTYQQPKQEVKKEPKDNGRVLPCRLVLVILLAFLGILAYVAFSVANSVTVQNNSILTESVPVPCRLGQTCEVPVPQLFSNLAQDVLVYLEEPYVYLNHKLVAQSIKKKVFQRNNKGTLDCQSEDCGIISNAFVSDKLSCAPGNTPCARKWDTNFEGHVSLRTTRKWPNEIYNVGPVNRTENITTPLALQHYQVGIEPPLMPYFRRLYTRFNSSAIVETTKKVVNPKEEKFTAGSWDQAMKAVKKHQNRRLGPLKQAVEVVNAQTGSKEIRLVLKAHYQPAENKTALYFTTVGKFGGKHYAIAKMLLVAFVIILVAVIFIAGAVVLAMCEKRIDSAERLPRMRFNFKGTSEVIDDPNDPRLYENWYPRSQAKLKENIQMRPMEVQSMSPTSSHSDSFDSGFGSPSMSPSPSPDAGGNIQMGQMTGQHSASPTLSSSSDYESLIPSPSRSNDNENPPSPGPMVDPRLHAGFIGEYDTASRDLSPAERRQADDKVRTGEVDSLGSRLPQSRHQSRLHPSRWFRYQYYF